MEVEFALTRIGSVNTQEGVSRQHSRLFSVAFTQIACDKIVLISINVSGHVAHLWQIKAAFVFTDETKSHCEIFI